MKSQESRFKKQPYINPKVFLEENKALTLSREKLILELSDSDKNKLGYSLQYLKEINQLNSKYLDLVIKDSDWVCIITSLHLQGLLNLTILEKLFAHKKYIHEIYAGLQVYNGGSFNLEILTILLKNPRHALFKSFGLDSLRKSKIHTEENVALLEKHPVFAMSIGSTLAALKDANILTPNNQKMISANVKRISEISYTLTSLEKIGGLTQESFEDMFKHFKNLAAVNIRLRTIYFDDVMTHANTQLLHYQTPKGCEGLVSSIHKMFSYGVLRLGDSEEIGLRAMKLALSLKGELKKFLETPLEIRRLTKCQFEKNFLELLQSENEKIGSDPKHKVNWNRLFQTVTVQLSIFFLIESIAILSFPLAPVVPIVGAVAAAATVAAIGYSLSKNNFFTKLNKEKVIKNITNELENLPELSEVKLPL